MKSKNKQIKELMEKQKIDKARGASYGARVAIESDTFQIPAAIKEIESKKIEIECTLSLARLLQTRACNE